MKKAKRISWLFLLALSFLLLVPSMPVFAKGKVYEITIDNEIEMGLHEYLKRSINEAEEAKADVIILNMHTPGGSIDAAVKIGKLLDTTQIPVVAFVNTNAISAGAYIALHADDIYMMPTATMGSAAPITSSGENAGEKVESYWSGEMKAAAKSSSHNRDPIYAEAMVDSGIDLQKLNKPVGKLLTLTAEEAFNIGYSEGTVQSFEQLLEELKFEGSEVVSIEQTFAEKLARFITNPIVVPILLSIASIGLVVELYSPGFGVPGMMGLSSLGLFFFGHTVAGFAGYESLILFAIGSLLIIAELFIPGGIIGIIGGVLVIASLLFAGESFTYMAYSVLLAIIIAGIGMVILMKIFGKKLHMFNKLVLKDATTTEEGYVSNANRIELIGKVGKALTPLRPSGTVAVENERLDVVTEGSYIDAGKTVEIIKVEGSRIVVREKLQKGGEVE